MSMVSQIPSPVDPSFVIGSPGPSLQADEQEYESAYKDWHKGESEKPSSRSDQELLSCQLTKATAEIARLRNLLEESRQRAKNDSVVISGLHQRIAQLEELVQKQKVTIITQSRTISDRRNMRKQSPMAAMVPVTPSHQVHQGQFVAHHSHYPPSGLVGIMVQQNSSSFETPQSIISPVSHTGNVFDCPPPKFELPVACSYPGYTPIGYTPVGYTPILHDPSVLARNWDVFAPMAVSAVPIPAPSAVTAATVGPVDPRKAMADFSTQFQELMRKSEVWSQAHASIPNIFRDGHIDRRVKRFMIAISSSTQASVLLGNVPSRGFLVAKGINYYLVERILTTTVIRGFDPAVDLEVDQIQKQMANNTPTSVRHLMLGAMANNLTNLSKKPGFTEFCRNRVLMHVTKLWEYIGPLTHYPPSQNGQAWMDLCTVVAEAQALAVNMHMVPLEYKFDFPESNEYFDHHTMINRDCFVLGDPRALNDANTRIRVGITPIVRIRDNSKIPSDIKLIYLSNVLLEMPRALES